MDDQPSPAPTSSSATDSWRQFCRRLEAMGDLLLTDDFPADPASVAEGQRHVTRLLRLALELHMEDGDPRFPRFVNHERPTHQWGGPNPDNFYLRSRIDPALTYRVRGNVSGVEQAIFSLMEGDLSQLKIGVYSERNLSDLHVGDDGSVEIIASATPHEGNWMPMDPAATNLTIRVFQSEWASQPTPYFHIDCLETDGQARPLPTPADVAKGLDQSMAWVEAAVPFWNSYLRTIAERSPANQLSAPTTPPGGADDISYGGGTWDLAPEEVLLVECDAPDADYWGFTMHTMPWFESGDFGRHQTSLNHRHVHIDTDGRIRVVVAHEDPGVPNWIDTEGRTQAVLTYRWIWARTKPTPTARVVPLADLAGLLPADHPALTRQQRQVILATRRDGMAQRFR